MSHSLTGQEDLMSSGSNPCISAAPGMEPGCLHGIAQGHAGTAAESEVSSERKDKEIQFHPLLSYLKQNRRKKQC